MSQPSANIIKSGELIKNELRSRGISQKEFAKAIGIAPSHLSDILSGRRRISTLFAQRTEELLGLRAQLLLDIQDANHVVRDRSNCSDPTEIDANAILASLDLVISTKTLLKFLRKKLKTKSEKLRALNEYYGLTSNLQEEIPILLQGCYRKSAVTGMDERMILSWVIIVRAVSRTVKPTGAFSIDNVPKLCETISKKLHNNGPNILQDLTAILSSYGIVLLRIDKVDRASIDGYSFYDNGTPYIALTCRYDRIDNLAFTLMHELAHIALRHTTQDRARINLDRRSYNEDYTDRIEDEANHFAAEMLIPSHIWQFAPTIPLNPALIKAKYTKWAEAKRLNPWIVLGRLSHETGIYKIPSDDSRKINGGKEVSYELTC